MMISFCKVYAKPKIHNMNKIKTIAIIAFDSKKTDLIEWSYFNKKLLIPHNILALGCAKNILEGTLNKKVKSSEAGILGENRYLCNLITREKIDALIIFGEADEIFESKELSGVIETATEHNIIVAANRTTADFILHSSLLDNEYSIAKKEKKPGDKEVITARTSFPFAKAS